MSDRQVLTVKEFNPEDKPQEKAEKLGIGALTLSELWAVILRVGQPGVPITDLTRELMRDNDFKLKILERRTRDELMQIPGIGPVRALQIEAVLEIMRRYNIEKLGESIKIRSSEDVFNYMRQIASHHSNEHIWVLTLSRSNNVISTMEVSSGGTSGTVFDVKTILRKVIATPKAEGVIMVHNHPSGNTRPSVQDDNITKILQQGCGYLGIKFLDHIIVTQESFYYYADCGRL